MPVQLTGVSYLYGQSPALSNIDLLIPEGCLTVLCGVTGSGKSTLLRLLSGLAKPSSGSIDYPPESSAVSASIVFQQPESQLFAASVRKDVEYGLEQRDVPEPRRSEAATRAMEQAGLDPEQYGQRSPFLLSGGEKRRVCIAGAIAPLPRLLLLDEPTAGLDPPAARALLDTVTELKRGGYTIVIATHDLDSFFPLADQVVVLSQGALRYSGPARGLWTEARVLEDAGLEPPAYIRISRMLMRQGRLDALPASAGELLARLDKRSLAHRGSGAASCAKERLSADKDSLALSAEGGPLPAGGGPLAEGMPPPAEDGRSARSEGRLVPGEGSAAQSPADEAAADAGARPAADAAALNFRAGSVLQMLDPRVKWLAMILWSLVFLKTEGAFPLALAALMIGGLLAAAGIPRKRIVWFYRPFLPMFLFLWLLSAFSWDGTDAGGPFQFSAEGALTGGLAVLRLGLLISLGFLFTETTSGAPLREGLEWAIAPLGRLGVRTRNWSLAVSVTLQFIPWVLGRISLLQLALASRGNRKRGWERWTPKQLSLMAVPLLLQVIGMGDELATAIEARGYDPSKPRTPWLVLCWQRRDTAALLLAVLAAALLWWASS
ncbi:energy-coupling factor transport system ATP-binding protein [Paenibacillus sophorae]|uniref:ATP-binding cassette domain-containing protein n=1 Tax=Paenibacillus sophorae TaxID=1333845 RepID=A0A1H8INJ4_9BACL|nr:ATP-binding cassette domain-containing protein [Paenibacillus sophorae]QWU16023.1 ATP-binding cassette domain-containing protein [Paenibacillus sophorae]SEN70154.1 energy-coupling factor transport system ATP-binding protein [Paenibacillus sophorae]